MILLTLPGVSVTYNGEEIGMVDVWISWSHKLCLTSIHSILISFLQTGMTRSIQLPAILTQMYTKNSQEIRKMVLVFDKRLNIFIDVFSVSVHLSNGIGLPVQDFQVIRRHGYQLHQTTKTLTLWWKEQHQRVI